VFYNESAPDLPRAAGLERLRLLLKDSPERFRRRLNQLPLVLLAQTDRATARRYQQALAQKGIVCRIETAPPARSPNESSPKRALAEAATVPPRADHPPTWRLPSGRRIAAGWRHAARLGLDLCFDPRGTIGRILTVVSYRGTLILAALIGLVQIAATVLDEFPAPQGTLLPKVLAVVILAPPLAILMVYLRGYLLYGAGRLLKGAAGPREVRIALAWSEIPLLAGGCAGFLQAATGGLGAAAGTSLNHSLPALLSWSGFGLLQAACVIWALGLLLHALAEIQGFSMGRCLASLLLAIAMVVVPLAIGGGILMGTGLLSAG
jgi:hypothetical protein